MDLKLTLIEGGREYFNLSGLYRSELYFTSKRLNCSWTIQKRYDTHIGNLKLNGEVIYNYRFYKITCQIQEVMNGRPNEWTDIEVNSLLCD